MAAPVPLDSNKKCGVCGRAMWQHAHYYDSTDTARPSFEGCLHRVHSIKEHTALVNAARQAVASMATFVAAHRDALEGVPAFDKLVADMESLARATPGAVAVMAPPAPSFTPDVPGTYVFNPNTGVVEHAPPGSATMTKGAP